MRAKGLAVSENQIKLAEVIEFSSEKIVAVRVIGRSRCGAHIRRKHRKTFESQLKARACG